ncbi:hypothetical protein [Mycolicibacterium fluoranthenivorans]|uniref:Uncharacterized protein n=1 Tax=Mycolicibacterium fluoranthenivorans TaxID=258505 RepID=A0A7X5TY71_9MYCO|nr:hypothetical protein [Mycolicibacterium fluoranthenivorans]MCV7358800.1 hypothetical protein [Mycolicibacterium fluoranthenivorans]NIH94914.1 hypothetical protein [Mycolicibacterium fluoranthenivorans]
MYGISPEENFDFLDRKLLQQMCFGENELILRFDDPTISIVIMADIEIVTHIRGRRLAEDPRSLASDLVDFLGKTITDIKSTQRALFLVFDDEYTLILHDSDENYECFTIKNGDRIIVV